MGQREKPRLQRPGKMPHIIGERFTRLRQVVTLGVLPHQQRQTPVRQLRQQRPMPLRRAFRARRQIAAFPAPRVTQPHGHNRHLVRVVERFRADLQPVAQPFTGRIIPGDTGFMNTRPRRLPHDQQPGALPGLHHWPRPQRQVRLTQPASAHLFQQVDQLCHSAGLSEGCKRISPSWATDATSVPS